MLIKEELVLYLSFYIKQLENWIQYMKKKKKTLAVSGYQDRILMLF